MTTLHPMKDILIIKMDKASQPKTAAGIITEVQEEECRTRGVVIAAGPGTYREGKWCPVEITVGAHVVFRDSYSIMREKIDGEEFLLMPETELVAVIDEAGQMDAPSSTDEGASA